MQSKYCCPEFNLAYDRGVIRPPDRLDQDRGLDNNRFYLHDRDCGVVEVEVPINLCPFCGAKL